MKNICDMKVFVKTLVFAACLSVLCSCIPPSPSPKEKSEEEKLELAIEQAEQSEQIEKDLFLGFKFGMSKNEVADHISKLISEEKVYISSTNRYQYDLYDENGVKFFVRIIPIYHEDQLYEVIYPIKSGIIAGENDHISIAEFFRNSDKGKGFKWYLTEDFLGVEQYAFVKDNLIVKFSNSHYPLMKYTNAPVRKIVNDLEELEIQEKAKESSSEF